MSSATDAIECNICCDKRYYFTTCLYCQQKACMSCTETFLLDNPQAKCMFCKNNWNTEFLQTNMRSGFMSKAYKNHIKTVIFDRERALFPETQMDIEQDKKNKEIDEKIKQKRQEIQKIKEEIEALEREKKGEKKEKKQVVQYSIPCTQTNCRGFLNQKSVCGICDKQHCSKCRVATDNLDEHKCDANTLETLKMLEKDTKPCPKCFTPIFKITGCDQMWCTQCKTPFSWKTGMIETGNIHNPHYWQYLQKEGRDLEQVREMNGLRRANNCENVVQNMAYDFLNERKYSEVCRLLLHIQGVDVRKYITENYIEENRELRKEFLTGKIDETKFKKTLQMRQKKTEFKDEVRQLLVMFHDVGRDTLKKLHTKFLETKKKWNEQSEKERKQVDEELLNLTTYVEDQLKKICDRYDYVVPNLVLGSIMRMKASVKLSR